MTSRSIARAILTLWLVASLAFVGWRVWRLATGWPGTVFVERSVDEIVAATDREMARVATPERLEALLSQRLAEEPREWISIDAIEAVVLERGVALPASIVEQVEEARAERSSYPRRCADCALDVEKCDLSPALFCRAPIELSPIGDLQGIATEIWNYASHEEVDEINLGLSIVGLGGTLLALPSGGSSTVAAASAKTLKFVYRLGRLPPSAAKAATHAVKNGVDWSGVRRLNPRSLVEPDELGQVIHPAAFRGVAELTLDMGRISEKAGLVQGVALFSRIDNAQDARRMAAGADALGPRTLGRVEVLGKSRFLRTTLRLSDNVIEAALGLVSALASLASLVFNATISVALQRLRRLAR